MDQQAYRQIKICQYKIMTLRAMLPAAAVRQINGIHNASMRAGYPLDLASVTMLHSCLLQRVGYVLYEL